jgi:hypothetical protein
MNGLGVGCFPNGGRLRNLRNKGLHNCGSLRDKGGNVKDNDLYCSRNIV